MPVRKTIPEKDGVYFITFTCARWLPLFKITNGYNVVYKWFDVLKKSGHYIIGYVTMPTHVHAIIAFNLNNICFLFARLNSQKKFITD